MTLYLTKTDYAFLRRLLAKGTMEFCPLNLYHLKAVSKFKDWGICTAYIDENKAEAFLLMGDKTLPENKVAVTVAQLNDLIETVKKMRTYKRTKIRLSPRHRADFIAMQLAENPSNLAS